MYSLLLFTVTFLTTLTIGFGRNMVDFDWPSGEKTYFYQTITNGSDYHHSRRFCESHNSTLVQIKSRDEQEFLYRHVPGGSYHNFYWIGTEPGHGQAPTTFIDGTDIKWFNWFTNLPKTKSDCVAIQVFAYYRAWFDYSCDESKSISVIVCERHTSSRRPLATPCADKTTICQNGGKCRDIIGRRSLCYCPPGYEGRHCEIKV